jgi:hypothetical protein
MRAKVGGMRPRSYKYKGMEAWKATLGTGYPSTLMSVSSLALTYIIHLTYGQDEPGPVGMKLKNYGLQAKELRLGLNVLGEMHPNTFISMNNPAIILLAQGRTEEAVAMREDCLRFREQIIGPEHRSKVSARITPASLKKKRGYNPWK